MTTEARYGYFLLFFLPVMLVLSFFQAHVAITLVYLVLGVFILFFDHALLLFLYVFLLATNYFLPEGAGGLGPLSGREIMAIFASYAGLKTWQESRSDPEFYSEDYLTGTVRYAYIFALFILAYVVLTVFRSIVTGFSPQYAHLDTTNAVVYSLKEVLKFIPVYFVIRLAKFQYFRAIFFHAFFFSAIWLSLGVILSPYLLGLGILVPDPSFDSHGVVLRHEGFFAAGGDVNSLAGFLGITFGYIISRIDTFSMKRITLYTGVVIIVTAVIFTGSRAGILCMVIVLIINFKMKNVLLYMVGFIALLLLVPKDVLIFVLDRFNLLSSEIDTTETGSRFYIWNAYLNHITDNPNILLAGADKPFYFGVHQFVPHNFYLTVVYRWGIFPLIFLSILFFRFLVYILRMQDNRTRKMLLSIFVSLFLVTNTVSDVGSFYAFYLCLAFTPIHEVEWAEELEWELT